MIKLQLPASLDESKALWTDLIDRKHRAARNDLEALEAQIFTRFDAYHRNGGAGLATTSWTSDEREQLLGCFASGRGTDEHIVAAARTVSSTHCPYCGLRLHRRPANWWHPMDHFLPRKKFPEFGAFVQNLVRCCDDCNEAKGTKVSRAGTRCFLHPYFDACLNETLLRATVADAGDGVPLVTFKLQTKKAGSLAAVAKLHVEILDVCARAADSVTEPLTHALLLVADSSATKVARDFQSLAAPNLQERPNDPMGLTLQAASESEDLPALLAAARDAKRRLDG